MDEPLSIYSHTCSNQNSASCCMVAASRYARYRSLRIWAALQHSRLSSNIHCQFTYYNTRKCEILKICDSFALSQLFLILFVGGNVSMSRVHFDHALTLSRDVVANKNSVSVLHTLEPQCVCIYHQNFLPLCRPINLPTGGHEKSAFFKQHVA